MFKKILRFASSCVLSIFIFSTTFFSGINYVVAAEMDSEMNPDKSMGIVIEDSSNNNTFDRSNTSAVPDLGDDQTFPFIPGFGKNSGKD